MRKQILIVGYTKHLQGVDADLENYYRFFTSPIGGQWDKSEIETLRDTTATNVLLWLNTYKRKQLDYFIFIFCGHGGCMDDEVIMELNETGEIIRESQVKGIAPRQLCIYDCCRAIEEDKTSTLLTETKIFSLGGKIYGNVRQRYEKRIMQAIPQTASLYACSIGECADGNRSGGYYTYNLLKCARHISDDTEYKTIGQCHNEACESVEIKNPDQHPDCSLPRCLLHRSLIFSIHP